MLMYLLMIAIAAVILLFILPFLYRTGKSYVNGKDENQKTKNKNEPKTWEQEPAFDPDSDSETDVEPDS